MPEILAPDQTREIELLDMEGNPIPTRFPQPLRDEVADFVTFEGRVYRFDELSAGRPEIAVYQEIEALRLGTATIHTDNIEGVPVSEIVGAVTEGQDA